MRSSRILVTAGLAIGLLSAGTLGVAASESAILTVAQDGSGDFEAIGPAIEAAADGDTVLVSPGVYVEGLFIDKAITLAGDGPREDVVVAPGVDELIVVEPNSNDAVATALHILEADAILEHISIQNPLDEGAVAWLVGGSPRFRDVSLARGAVAMVRGEPVFQDSFIDAYFAVRDGASPTVEDSELLGHASIDGPGKTTIRRSTLHQGSSASGAATGAYEDNLFIGGPLVVDTGSDMLVKGNTVEGIIDEVGILVRDDGSSAQIIGNTVTTATMGIAVDSKEPASEIIGNDISDVRVGIHVRSDGATVIEDNTIDDAMNFGIVLVGGQPSVSGNSICGADQALDLRGETNPELGDNEIC